MRAAYLGLGGVLIAYGLALASLVLTLQTHRGELSLDAIGCAYLRDYTASQGGKVDACRLSTRRDIGAGRAEATFDLQLGNNRLAVKLRFARGLWQATFAGPSS